MTDHATPPNTRRALTLDTQMYQSMLDAPDIPDTDKAELIEALWLLVVSFVDLGFEIHTEQSCGQLPDETAPAPDARADMVTSKQSQPQIGFTDAANAKPAQHKEAS